MNLTKKIDLLLQFYFLLNIYYNKQNMSYQFVTCTNVDLEIDKIINIDDINNIEKGSFCNFDNIDNICDRITKIKQLIYVSSLLETRITTTEIERLFCFRKRLVKKWNGQLLLLLWNAQKNLNHSNINNKNFIKFLKKINATNKCSKSELDKIKLFIINTNTCDRYHFVNDLCQNMLGLKNYNVIV
jgi:hypothetical protein